MVRAPHRTVAAPALCCVQTREEEARTRLGENYVLIAKLSAENLRLTGEQVGDIWEKSLG